MKNIYARVVVFSAFIFGLVINDANAAPKFLPKNENAFIGGMIVQSDDPLAFSTVGLVISPDDPNSEYDPWLCTGTLVSKDLVLTAAHCIEGGSRGTVVFSTMFDSKHLEKTDTSLKRPFQTIKVSPDYPMGMDEASVNGEVEYSDYALVRFAGELPKGYVSMPIITESERISYLRQNVVVQMLGYGITREASTDAGVLRKGLGTLSGISKIGPNLWVRARPRITCMGDSGGPALLKIKDQFVLFGVLSRSDCEQEAIYTRFFKGLFDSLL